MLSLSAREVVRNLAMGIPAVRRLRMTRPRSTAAFNGEISALERYAVLGLRCLLRCGVDPVGRTILEIGPGDNLVSGLSMLAAGAKRYVGIDRFGYAYESREAAVWYRALAENWSSLSARPWPEWLAVDRFPKGYPSQVEAAQMEIENAAPLGKFDIVCSFQVAELVRDLTAFIRVTNESLETDGVAVHRVYYGPHGRWALLPDPLTFLRLSDRQWSMVSSNRGLSNRYRANEVRAALEAAGFSVELRETTTYADSEIAWQLLAPRFRSMPREAVLVRDETYVCRRRSGK